MKNLIFASFLLAACVIPSLGQGPSANDAYAIPVFAKVQLDNSLKLSKLKPGDPVEGHLSSNVYSLDRELYAAGSTVHLTVDHVERKRKIPGARWPGIARLFMPRHENVPIFRQAVISMPDGTASRLEANMVSSSRMKEIWSPAPRSGSGSASPVTSDRTRQSQAAPKSADAPVLYLEAHLNADQATHYSEAGQTPIATSGTAPAGTLCRVLLLSSLSGAKSHAGDPIQARLLEPVIVDSHVLLPAGSLFEGRVLKSIPPRIPARAGSLTIAFESVTLPQRGRIEVSASVSQVEVTSTSPTKLDREGRLRGSRPGAIWFVVNGGVSAGLAKVTDDTLQLIIESVVSTATDASTAGTARIAAAAVSGAFLLTRKGQDVVLPGHTEMSITLNRPLTLSAQIASSAPAKKD
ncbi:MAG TPA: hypothetical protein VMP68_31860 [Candidatus Eisenbacteria bacterium]|nr:hypothetical protein [Candidatus Eisenbacteria bacterium]